MSTIITPNIAYFKDGEVYVYTLPEEPKEEYFNKLYFTLDGTATFKYLEACRAFDKAVSYAREHPFKVQSERDKRIILWEMRNRDLTIAAKDFKDWFPQDLTEYRIEGLRMEIEEREFGHVDNYNEPHGFEQVACLIEDDGVKEEKFDPHLVCAPAHKKRNLKKLAEKVRALKQSPSEEKQYSDSEKLILLADWFEKYDLTLGRIGQDECQKDLRRIAGKILELNEQVELSLNAAKLFESKLKELEKSDQETLSSSKVNRLTIKNEIVKLMMDNISEPPMSLADILTAYFYQKLQEHE